ncbi:MAG TPA: radical SAM protein, partial [bacterium]|nr:radical SAM protein [bacterium]
MKIVLIQPAIEDFYITKQRTFPAGLVYIASYLEKHGLTAKIFDCITGVKPLKIPIDSELEYLSEYYQKDFSPAKLFHEFYRFGYSNKEFEQILIADYSDADVFCIASNFTPYYKTVLEYCGILKKNFPEKPVIAGGNNIPVMYDLLLKSGYIDFTIFGEGENTLKSLLFNLNAPEIVSNIAFIKNGKIKITNKSNEFNINDNFYKLDFINPDKYKIGKYRSMSIVTSRGCRYNCSFCCSNKNSSGYCRKSIGLVKEELKYNIEKFNISAIDIEDENFTADRNYAMELCSYLSEKFSGIRLYFMNGLHYLNLDYELLKHLRSAGIKNLNLSLVDCGAEKYLRKTNLPHLTEIITQAEKLEMNITAYLIIGLPGQKPEDVFKTVNYLTNQKNVVIGASIFYPLPNLEIINSNINILKNISYSAMRMTAASLETPDFSRIDIMTLFRLIRTLNIYNQFKYQNCDYDYSEENQNIISKKKLEQRELFNVL